MDIFEKNLQELVGLKIKFFYYFFHRDNKHLENKPKLGHPLYYGLTICLNNNKILFLYGQSNSPENADGINYSYKDPDYSWNSDIKKVDVSEKKYLEKCIDNKIISIKVWWLNDSWEDDYYKVIVPQEIVIKFENGEYLLFSATEIVEDEICNIGSDELLVVYSEDIAKKFGLEKYGKGDIHQRIRKI
jgi:hypothetical protein